MYIKDILAAKETTLSLEVFPPKKTANFDSLKPSLERMCSLPIDYISVTYGAGGSTSKNTPAVAAYIKDEMNTTSLAHLTCWGSSKADIKESLGNLKDMGIQNILALRGDKPRDTDVPPGELKYASELTAFIKENGDFCVGGACYPERHPDSESDESDIENLKKKADSGCDFLVTQMFFDNDVFWRFCERAAAAGINIPIIAGIMPLTSASQIEKMCILSGGATMPSNFTRMAAKFYDNPEALKQAGITYAISQITDLIAAGVDGIHIYTMNKPDVAEKIVDYVKALLITN